MFFVAACVNFFSKRHPNSLYICGGLAAEASSDPDGSSQAQQSSLTSAQSAVTESNSIPDPLTPLQPLNPKPYASRSKRVCASQTMSGFRLRTPCRPSGPPGASAPLPAAGRWPLRYTACTISTSGTFLTMGPLWYPGFAAWASGPDGVPCFKKHHCITSKSFFLSTMSSPFYADANGDANAYLKYVAALNSNMDTTFMSSPTWRGVKIPECQTPPVFQQLTTRTTSPPARKSKKRGFKCKCCDGFHAQVLYHV